MKTITINQTVQVVSAEVKLPYHINFRAIYVRINDKNNGLAVKNWSNSSEITRLGETEINIYLENANFKPISEDDFIQAYDEVVSEISKQLPAL